MNIHCTCNKVQSSHYGCDIDIKKEYTRFAMWQLYEKLNAQGTISTKDAVLDIGSDR